MQSDLNFTVDKIAEMANWPYFQGFTADTCGTCRKSANVPVEAGWLCECGHYNILSWNGWQIPFDAPDMGPSRADILAGYARAKEATR